MPAHLVTDVCMSPLLREGCSSAIWSPVRGDGAVRGARGQRGKAAYRRLALVP